jgi:uncharacterized protein YqhQ
MVIAIIVFSIVGKSNIWLMVGSRIVLVPVIAALGYEFIYFTSRHTHNPILRWMTKPGMWIQALTTREPDDKQMEVALAALQKVIDIEETVPASQAVSIPAPQVTAE